MKFLERAKYFVQQNCPNAILQPAMRWMSRRRYAKIANAPTSERFDDIFHKRAWGGDSVSGVGSDMGRTEVVRAFLPGLIGRLGIKSILDVPCGDFHWMQHVDLHGAHYIGGDIVRELIAEDQKRFGSANREFRDLDLTKDPLPSADLLLVRDCFIHLSFADIAAALKNIRASGCKYLLTTTFPQKRRHWDIVTGGFRWVNLQLAPFNLPAPMEIMLEEPDHKIDDDKYADRSLGLWQVSAIPAGK